MATTINIDRIEEIYQEAVRTPMKEVAQYLQSVLGQKLTVYLSGLNDPKVVGMWSSGKVEPREMSQIRLRHAYLAARILVYAYGEETAKSWFIGTNTRLDSEAPAYVLRYAKTLDDLQPVVPAARSACGVV